MFAPLSGGLGRASQSSSQAWSWPPCDACCAGHQPPSEHSGAGGWAHAGSLGWHAVRGAVRWCAGCGAVATYGRARVERRHAAGALEQEPEHAHVALGRRRVDRRGAVRRLHRDAVNLGHAVMGAGQEGAGSTLAGRAARSTRAPAASSRCAMRKEASGQRPGAASSVIASCSADHLNTLLPATDAAHDASTRRTPRGSSQAARPR